MMGTLGARAAPPIDAGTLVSVPSRSRAILGSQLGAPPVQAVKSRTVTKEAADAATVQVAQLTYDAFVRQYVYDPGARLISAQGEEFVRTGLMTRQEAATWVNAQRNALLIATRDTNSPIGRAYAEYLKPRTELPDVPQLVAKIAKDNPALPEEMVFEAIIKSGAKTRGSVNRVAMAFRWAGPVLIVVSVSYSAYLIAEAPPEQRGQVAAREGGALAGGLGAGWAGGWLGCKAGAAVGVWFDGVGAIPGCLIGAVVVGGGFGWAGGTIGAHVGEFVWTEAHTAFEWQ